MILDYAALEDFFVRGVAYYEQSAPVVARHLDEIYILVHDGARELHWLEVVQLFWLHDAQGWMPPNHAANYIYKLRQEFGRDTTGYAGF